MKLFLRLWLRVSILVVVESALRGFSKTWAGMWSNGFNPCCSGIGPAGVDFGFDHIVAHCFNPCCSGIGPAGAG